MQVGIEIAVLDREIGDAFIKALMEKLVFSRIVPPIVEIDNDNPDAQDETWYAIRLSRGPPFLIEDEANKTYYVGHPIPHYAISHNIG